MLKESLGVNEGGMLIRSQGGHRLKLRVHIPEQQETVEFDVPLKHTVWQVKSDLIASVSALFSLNRDKFQLAFGDGETPERNEYARLRDVESLAVQRGVMDGTAVDVYVVASDEADEGRRSYVASPKSMPLNRSPTSSRASAPATVSVANVASEAAMRKLVTPDALHWGWLTKQGAKRKNWKRRWFVMVPGRLMYYATLSERAAPLGVIDLGHAFAVALDDVGAVGRDNCFTIYTPERNYLLSADTTDDRTMWIETLKSSSSTRPGDSDRSPMVEARSQRTTPSLQRTTPVASPGPVARKEGFLTKMGAQRKNWKKRWFVLANDTLSYYKSPKDKSPQGQVALRECLGVEFNEMRPFCFSIRLPQRTYYMAAASQVELTEWMNAISRARRSVTVGVPRSASEDDESSSAVLAAGSAATLAAALSGQPTLSEDLPSPVGRRRGMAAQVVAPVVEDEQPVDWSVVRVIPRQRSRSDHIALLSHQHQQRFDMLFPRVAEVGKRDDEVEAFRGHACSLRRYAERYDRTLRNHVMLAPIEPSAEMLSHKIALVMFVVLDGERHRTAIVLEGSVTVRNAVREVLSRMQSRPGWGSKVAQHFGSDSDVVVQVYGRRLYILDERLFLPLYLFQHVRTCYYRANRRVQLILLDRSSLGGQLRAAEDDASTVSASSRTGSGGGAPPMLESAERDSPVIVEDCYDVSVFPPVHKFWLKVLAVEDASTVVDPNVSLSVEVHVVYGRKQLGIFRTPRSRRPLWNLSNSYVSPVSYCDLPRETRVVFRFLLHRGTESVCVAWGALAAFDHVGNMRCGAVELPMWPGDVPAVPPPAVPCNHGKRRIIRVEFLSSPDARPITYQYPVHEPLDGLDDKKDEKRTGDPGNCLHDLLAKDVLHEMSPSERAMVWKHREYVRREHPAALPRVLECAEWDHRSAAAEAHALLQSWRPLEPVAALQLLGPQFPDARVRHFACASLNRLSDARLMEVLPQLVQALKFEVYHDSSLARLLLRRACRNRLMLGQRLLWLFQAELTVEATPDALRFVLMTQALLMIVDAGLRDEFLNQLEFVRALNAVALALKKLKKDQRQRRLPELLGEVRVPRDGLTLPYDPSLRVSAVLIDRCKVLDSFTAPLRLEFENASTVGDSITAIYKNGDDLRQDALTLQMFGLMDRLWKDAGLDMCMTLYEVLPTSPESGFIEVVENSKTCAEIQKLKGGATAVFAQSTIMDWLKLWVKDSAMPLVIENFRLSCAGYSVATFTLGIGDRHNDNVMVSRTGHLFHIDFGHFLGSVLKFGPINRDKAPFCFTPDMAYVFGGRDSPGFRDFVALAARAYNVLRANGALFVTFFSLMLSTGMPQLSCADDVRYLEQTLRTNISDAEAEKYFGQLVTKSLESKISQMNFAFHILAHRN